MSEELSAQLLALYRAGAVEEPDERMDATILAAAQRRRVPHVVFAIPAVLLLAAATTIAFRQGKPAQSFPEPVSAGLRPGMADGRGQFLASSAQPERIGMNLHPGLAQASSQSGE